MYLFILSLIDNGALMGGVIKAGSTSVTLKNSWFEHNVASNAGVIYLDDKSYLKTSNVTFLNNKAYEQAGVIEVVTKSYFFID